ncbi:hypothetical protein H696_04321 [Fonticula alba]|uniref:V-type proton ATPase subunit S1/VOA1 transmembrane domain-containing protein n=1 Tax=Fonticula alba TaxID=691883 RepID=A0A058Z5V5_FONAL|nr:hypothetical protein H696_04321 [Fonticula alba]KCV68902.1 hypothetical protein H696_04321 [Fonticula alba]|eukprot:XP_009496473.1 hypothetical protein H696_04321 [Fonticula alba]
MAPLTPRGLISSVFALLVLVAGVVSAGTTTVWSDTEDLDALKDATPVEYDVASLTARLSDVPVVDVSIVLSTFGDALAVESAFADAIQAANSFASYPHVAGSAQALSTSVVGDLATKNAATVIVVDTTDELLALDLAAAAPAVVDISFASGDAANFATALTTKLTGYGGSSVSVLLVADTAIDAPAESSTSGSIPGEGASKADRFWLTGAGMFDAYTFFAPAVFMGIITLIVLGIILLSAYSCLASLKAPDHFQKSD